MYSPHPPPCPCYYLNAKIANWSMTLFSPGGRGGSINVSSFFRMRFPLPISLEADPNCISFLTEAMRPTCM